MEEDDYPQLPEDLVEKITADHFETYSHLVAFSGVCKSWRSASLNLYNRRRHHPQPPFLPGIFISSTHCYYNSRPIRQCFLPFSEIFHGVDNVVTPPLPNFRTRRRSFLRGHKTLEQSENSEEEEEESTPSYISVNLEKLKTKYQFTIQIDLAKYHIVASRDGWLVLTFPTTTGHLPLQMYLLNPVTGAHISLPLLRHDRLRSGKYDGGSVLLSASPDYNDDDCHVVIVTDFSDTPQVAWCNVRSGGRRWKFISKDSRFINKPKSAAYIGGNLYVLDSVNSVHVFHDLITNTTTTWCEDDDAPHPNPTVRSFHFSPEMLLSTPYDERSFHHVLELNGEPIVILRHCWYKDLVTVKVYKLVGGSSSSSSSCWEEVKSLEGCAVFLGNHNSMSVALNNNDNKMLKGNHIYYLDYDPHHTSGGVYNLEHRKLVQRFGSFGFYRVNFCYWFSPMPWDIRKHLKKKKDKVWKWDSMQPKETIDEPTLVTLCKNRFQALSLTDDDDDDDDEEEDGE